MKKNNAFAQLITNHGLTLLSLLVVLGMLVIVQTMQKGGVLSSSNNLKTANVEFNLTSTKGQPFTQENLTEKYTLLYFGYTFCPDICPATLSNITAAYGQLTPAQQTQVQVVLISVDPKRDTLEHLSEYMAMFNNNFIGVTGEKSEIDKAVANYGAAYKIQPPAKPNNPEFYLVDHTGWAYLTGYQGEFIKRYPHNLEPENLLKDLQLLLAK